VGHPALERTLVNRLLLLAIFATASLSAARCFAEGEASALIIAGAGGTDEYAGTFEGWAATWQEACATGGVRATVVTAAQDGKESLARVRAVLDSEPKDGAELWLVLLGHGTFDGRDGKLNLAGDDLPASEIVERLKAFKRPVVIVCGFSASGAFLKPLSAPGRVIVTATRSGREDNFARFGGAFSEAIGDTSADLDKDGQTSVLEAWLWAANKVNTFYQSEGRLATEHALLDDNGDGLGTPPDWFKGVRPVKKAKDGTAPDGLRANQLHLIRSRADRGLPPEIEAERNGLELELARLRETKATLPEPEYFAKLEAILTRIAQLYRDAAADRKAD
jgi:hypothetical protein